MDRTNIRSRSSNRSSNNITYSSSRMSSLSPARASMSTPQDRTRRQAAVASLSISSSHPSCVNDGSTVTTATTTTATTTTATLQRQHHHRHHHQTGRSRKNKSLLWLKRLKQVTTRLVSSSCSSSSRERSFHNDRAGSNSSNINNKTKASEADVGVVVTAPVVASARVVVVVDVGGGGGGGGDCGHDDHNMHEKEAEHEKCKPHMNEQTPQPSQEPKEQQHKEEAATSSSSSTSSQDRQDSLGLSGTVSAATLAIIKIQSFIRMYQRRCWYIDEHKTATMSMLEQRQQKQHQQHQQPVTSTSNTNNDNRRDMMERQYSEITMSDWSTTEESFVGSSCDHDGRQQHLQQRPRHSRRNRHRYERRRQQQQQQQQQQRQCWTNQHSTNLADHDHERPVVAGQETLHPDQRSGRWESIPSSLPPRLPPTLPTTTTTHAVNVNGVDDTCRSSSFDSIDEDWFSDDDDDHRRDHDHDHDQFCCQEEEGMKVDDVVRGGGRDVRRALVADTSSTAKTSCFEKDFGVTPEQQWAGRPAMMGSSSTSLALILSEGDDDGDVNDVDDSIRLVRRRLRKKRQLEMSLKPPVRNVSSHGESKDFMDGDDDKGQEEDLSNKQSSQPLTLPSRPKHVAVVAHNRRTHDSIRITAASGHSSYSSYFGTSTIASNDEDEDDGTFGLSVLKVETSTAKEEQLRLLGQRQSPATATARRSKGLLLRPADSRLDRFSRFNSSLPDHFHDDIEYDDGVDDDDDDEEESLHSIPTRDIITLDGDDDYLEGTPTSTCDQQQNHLSLVFDGAMNRWDESSEVHIDKMNNLLGIGHVSDSSFFLEAAIKATGDSPIRVPPRKVSPRPHVMRKIINEQKFGLTTTTTTNNSLLTPPVAMDPLIADAAKSNDRFTKSVPCYAALQTPKRKVSLFIDTLSSHGTATSWTTEYRLNTEKVRPARDVSETNMSAVQARKDIFPDTNRLEETVDHNDRASKHMLTAGRMLSSSSSSTTQSKGGCQKASPKSVTDMMADQTRRVVLQQCNINTCGDGDDEEELDADIDDDDHFPCRIVGSSP